MSQPELSAFCRAQLLPLLSDISEAITDRQDLSEIMDLVVKVLVQHMGKTRKIVLSILNRASGAIYIESAWGLSDEERARGVYKVGEGITGRVIQSGIAVLVPEVSKEPGFLNRTGALQPGDVVGTAFICVPIRVGREVVGTLGMYRSSPKGSQFEIPEKINTPCRSIGDFTLQQDQEVLTIISSMIAQAVELHRARKEENTQLLQENLRLKDQLAARYHPSQIIGTSKPMQDLFHLLERVYNKQTPVLILGETGAGKELVAQALHYNSSRSSGPFVRFNCAVLPESLTETELFGHEKGAFTGAASQRKGRFEEAHEGTLFLDEVGELSLPAQAKLLRVLQTSQFQRIGGNQTISVDVRFITATNRNLTDMIKTGEFREDLYYRLSVFPIILPPLRERGSDILLLADYFIEKYAELHNSPVRRLSSPAIELLMAYHWPGNVRELENAIERAVILSDDGVIHSYHLPPSLQTSKSSNTRYQGNLEQKLEQVERETIIEAIKASQGKMALAARDLGLTERVMALRMKKHSIDWRLYRGNSLPT